uniref:Uncharacterized protein n=1 Tax=Acanthochromis polyacanthus TaxID=80966 RepID=A0A3Q1F9G1_9TELE
MLLMLARVKGKIPPFWSDIEISQTHTLNVSRVKKSLSEGALRPSDLLAQFKQIDSRTRAQIRAAELIIIIIWVLLFVPTELLSGGDVENVLQVTGCSAELQTPSCQTGCLSERYRSITGECNNRSELT